MDSQEFLKKVHQAPLTKKLYKSINTYVEEYFKCPTKYTLVFDFFNEVEKREKTLSLFEKSVVAYRVSEIINDGYIDTNAFLSYWEYKVDNNGK